MVGSKVGHYKIVDLLGSGGMSEVYLAEDSQLNRSVALKFLSAFLCIDENFRVRFMREARTAAGLAHPNIVTIYEVGRHKDRPFISMEYIHGESLRTRSDKQALTLEEALELTLQISDGLIEAHRRGVVHRDIKPSNVLIDDNGRVKLIDFGVAAVIGTDFMLERGLKMGTVGYMSPEQIQGKTVDKRSDLFSLGIVLYEMIASKPPFTARSQLATIQATLKVDPAPLSDYRPDIPNAIQRILTRALQKDAEKRYQAIEDFRSDLRHALVVIQRSQAGPSNRQLRHQPSIAIMSFVNQGIDKEQDYLCDGIAEEITNSLTKVRGLNVVSWSVASAFRGSQIGLRDIGRRLNVDTMLEGTVQKSENRLRISVRLNDINSGFQLWSERYDRQIEDIFEIQDEIAESVVQALRVVLTDNERRAIEKVYTTHLEAYDYYLRGRQFFHQARKKSLEYARQMFNRAIHADPNYALAYAGLADCCSFLVHWYGVIESDNIDQADNASLKALELDPELPEAHASRGLALWQMARNEEADKEFETAIRLDPKHYDARYYYGRACFQQGRLSEAVYWFEEACKIRDDYEARYFAAQTYSALSRKDQAEVAYRQSIKAVEKHLELNPDDARAVTMGAVSLCRTGDRKRGLEWAERALAIDVEDAGIIYNVACLFSLEGQKDRALESLEKALAAGFANREWLDKDPDLDPIRKEPKFQSLLEQYRPDSSTPQGD